jgi:hypothetical protein
MPEICRECAGVATLLLGVGCASACARAKPIPRIFLAAKKIGDEIFSRNFLQLANFYKIYFFIKIC